MAASASVGLNFRAPRTWSGRCMRNSETPAGFKPKKVAQKGPECDAKVCLTRPSNPLKTLGPGLNSCLTFVSRPCMRNGTQMKKKLTVQWTARCLGWLELQGTENMEWTMHAKQRNPSRIQAQEVAQKGPECDAKVCLTRPSNPLKTLGPGLNSCLTFSYLGHACETAPR